MRPRSDAEPLPKSCGQSGAPPVSFLGVFALDVLAVHFSHAPERRQTLLHGRVSHPPCVQRPV